MAEEHRPLPCSASSPVPRQALPMQEVPEQPQPHRTREFHIQLLFLFIQTGGQLLPELWFLCPTRCLFR